jgi:hypothetical protein
MNLTEWEFSYGSSFENPNLMTILIKVRDGEDPETNTYEIRQIIYLPTVRLLIAPIGVLQSIIRMLRELLQFVIQEQTYGGK